MTNIRDWSTHELRLRDEDPPVLDTYAQRSSERPGLRGTTAGFLCWVIGVLVACGLVVLFLVVFALGTRDIIQFVLGGH